jgi:hypothetical protein
MAKCKECKKDFAAGVKAAYKLGLQDGRGQLNHTINLIHKTNRALYDELLRIDKFNPLSVNSVILSREQVKGVITALRKAGKFYQARKLKRIETSQIGDPDSAESKLRGILEYIDEEINEK